MIKDEYLIHELAEETGISPRTIRYYQQESLLPDPVIRGKFAYYTIDHLERLKLIQELKKNHLPLKEIREHLNTLTYPQVQALLEGQKTEKKGGSYPGAASTAEPPQEDPDSAVEYIQRLLQPQSDFRDRESAKTPPAFYKRSGPDRYVAGSPSESWQRILISTGIEIHIRGPLSPQDRTRIEELIKFSRRLFLKGKK